MTKEFEIEIDEGIASAVMAFLENNINLGYESINDFSDHALRCFLLQYYQGPSHIVEEVVELQR